MATSKGGWIQDKILGSGGFGQVILWKHEESDAYVAIKYCRVQHEMTEKQRHRWKLEVDIMKRLDHPNVISAKDVPLPLDVMEKELPVLAMEYCSGGDLRKVLNLPENCCGLKEYDIRCLVKDIASAIEYLHGKRIIHRDLKPENIVLALTEENKIMYKLIDLGYAKELDQDSVCTSFVGTLQYLAPELFASQKYTCTVDYWSFGTVVFECVTGNRPFLPQVPPVTWHREVCQKSPDDICAYYAADGMVKFSKKIVTHTHLCRSMQAYFEQWLRIMLRWDPKERGGGLVADDKRPKCFKFLETMLDMKIVNILNVSTNQLLSYPLIEQLSMQDLQKTIEHETRIKVEDQDILLASGVTPDPNLDASQCWNVPGEEDWVVFLFKKGNHFEYTTNFKTLPTRVQHIVREAKTLLPYSEQKKSWAEAVWFCNEQVVDFNRLILSQRAAMLSLLRTNSNFLKLKNKMLNECDHLFAKLQYFKESLQFDINMYADQRATGGLVADELCKTWKKMGDDLDALKAQRDQVNKLDQQATALQTKIVELQRSPFARAKQNDTLEAMEKKSRELYQELRQAGKGKGEQYKDHKPMVEVVAKSIMNRDKSLSDLYTHLGKICVCKYELNQILPNIQRCCKEIMESSNKLIQVQRSRQEDIWNLVRKAHIQRSIYSGPDSKGSSSNLNSEQASMLMSVCGERTSLESMKVCEDNKENVKRLGSMMQHVLQEQEEMASIMDWSFLPPVQKK